MSQILLPQRFLAQPQYAARLDPAHPLFKDIVFAYSAGRGLHDGKHGLGSVVGTMLSRVGQKGRYIQPNDASSYAQFADNADYNVLGEVTIIAQIRTGGVTIQQGVVTKCETSGGANTPWALLIESDGAVSLNRSNASGGTPFRVWASSAKLSANTNYVIAVSQVADIGVAPKFYINQAFDSGAATSLYGGLGTGAPTSNTTSVKIGNRTDLANQFFGEVYDALVFKRALSASEIAALSRNIWAAWKAPERRIWVATSFDVTVALSGQALAISQGSLGVDTSVALSGQQGSLSSGTLSTAGDAIVALSGQSLSSAQGLLFPATDVSLTGQALASSQGGLEASLDVGLSGQALALSQGTIGTEGDVTVVLAGIGMIASQGTLSPPQTQSEGGHFAGVQVVGRKRKKRDLVDRDREDIKRLIREQIEGVRQEIVQAEVPQEVKKQARAAIQTYQSASSVDVQAMQEELSKVRQMLHMWEQQVKQQKLQRQIEEDEELLMMFL